MESAIVAAVFLAGLALIAVGTALVYLPAGLIVAGAGCTALAVLYERGRRA